MKFYSKKIIRLKNADMHLHYANNRGRGSDNVTVTIVKTGTKRPEYTRQYENFIGQFRVSGWRGNVNIPDENLREHGGVLTS